MLSIITKATQLTSTIAYGFAGGKRITRSLVKRYPNKYRAIFKMKKVNWTPDMKFPIRVPININYMYKPIKTLYYDNNQKIRFERLTGNEILLAFENLNTLTYHQIMEGLERLAQIPGQEKHKWRQHEWINAAFEHIKKNFFTMYKKQWGMRFYKLMNTLRNDDPEMWKLIYKRIEELLHTFSVKEFIYFWEKYHNDTVNVSAEFREDLFKMLDGRLRNFPPKHIVNAFKILYEHNRITPFYIHNVFVPLFRNPQYDYKCNEISEILKLLMFVSHENDKRFYDNFYPRILKIKFESLEQLNKLKQTLKEAQDIFKSHNLMPYISYVENSEGNIKARVKVIRQPFLYEIVRQDMIYYKEKLKIQQSVI